MSAYELLNLSINVMWKRDKLQGLPRVLQLLLNEFKNPMILEYEC